MKSANHSGKLEVASQKKWARLEFKERAASDKELIARPSKATSITLAHNIYYETSSCRSGCLKAKKRYVRASRFTAGLIVKLLVNATDRNR